MKKTLFGAASVLLVAFCALGDLILGEVAIVRVNADTDGFSVLALRNLLAGETLYWTDAGWSNNNVFSTAEGAGSTDILTTDIAAGTVFDVTAASINGSGEQIFLFLGVKTAPTLLYGIDWGTEGWSNDCYGTASSADPFVTGGGLQDIHTVAIASISDVFSYTGIRTGTVNEVLTAISDSANWSPSSDTTWQDGTFELIPEPSTWLLTMSAAGLLFFLHRRSQS